MNTLQTSFVYDAQAVSQILGIPCECSDSVPEAADGEIVIYYGGWDLTKLRDSVPGYCMLNDKDPCYKQGWVAQSGYYRVILRVPNSNRKSWSRQLLHLKAAYPVDTGWKPAPIAVAATALLVHMRVTGQNPLGRSNCRCLELIEGSHHAGLSAFNGRVIFESSEEDDVAYCHWLAAARKL